jgi:hypothetical protein
MSPIQIEILLHYHCCVDEYRDGDLSAPAVQETLRCFVDERLLEPVIPTDAYTATFKTTPRAEALISAWCDMPLPVQVWVIPEDGSK